jgi:predicted outer membrane protein
MLGKTLAALFIPLCITVTAGAEPPASGRPDTAESSPDAAKLGEALSVLHAVSDWSTTMSQMAEKRAKSDLVKNYAHEMATANANADAKLRSAAQKAGVDLVPINPQTEEGKSLLARMKAEKAMLGSLEGDAFDKEYMTLVTNTQQSVLHLLEASKASAKEPAVQQFLADMTTTVQNRLKTAQDIMAKIYGNNV